MNFSRSSVSFIDDSEQKNFEETDYLVPETHYSPKDKVSNATWNNKLPVGNDMGIITARKNEIFGCVVQLDYEKIRRISIDGEYDLRNV